MAVEQARTMRHKGTVPSRARPLDARAHSSSLPANRQPRAWLQPLPKQSLLVNSTEYKRLETAPVSPIMCHVGFRLRASLVGANNAVPTSGRPRSDIPLCCHLPSTSCPSPHCDFSPPEHLAPSPYRDFSPHHDFSPPGGSKSRLPRQLDPGTISKGRSLQRRRTDTHMLL